MANPEKLIEKTRRRLNGRFPDKVLRELVDARAEDPRLQALVGASVLWADSGGLEYFRGIVGGVRTQPDAEDSRISWLLCRVDDKEVYAPTRGWLPTSGYVGLDILTVRDVTITDGVVQATGPGEHGKVSFDFTTSAPSMPPAAPAHQA
jgi:hypothetical protein